MRELHSRRLSKKNSRGLDNLRESPHRKHSRRVFLQSQLANVRVEGSGIPNEGACSVIRP